VVGALADGRDVLPVVAPACVEAECDGVVRDAEGLGRGLVGRIEAVAVGALEVTGGAVAGAPPSASCPAASITRQVTAATATTVIIHTSTASAVERPFI
jgi:hypothetical protein